MSPILDLQRRHSTTFRLRIGEKVATSNGKTKPVRLTDSIRVTSVTPEIVDAFVAQYGGERTAWEGQWEAKLPITQLPILLLPGQSITAWWEHWAGATCQRRCDGYEMTTGEPCVCPDDPDARMADRHSCKPTTRLSVICPEVEVLGAGMLVTHGKIAAEELPSSVMVAEAALSRGIYVPAKLVIEEVVGPGKRFVVPRIYPPRASFAQLQSGQVTQAIGPAPAPAIDRPQVPALAAPSASPDEGPGEATPPAPPNHVEAVRAMLDQVPEEWVDEVKAAWKAAGLGNIKGLSGPDAERASELIAEVLERAERRDDILAMLRGRDDEEVQRIMERIGGPITGTEEEENVVREMTT